MEHSGSCKCGDTIPMASKHAYEAAVTRMQTTAAHNGVVDRRQSNWPAQHRSAHSCCNGHRHYSTAAAPAPLRPAEALPTWCL